MDHSQRIYRPDVDGLRSVAVLLVVLFHFDISIIFGAGFIGVDMFFVISGFLIVPAICEQVSRNGFEFSTFYARRIRRLAPALIVVAVLTLFAGLLILTPLELIGLVKEILASQVYLSNFYYWKYLNYFGLQSDGSFFLHTWSLGVEEQFYLIFPLLIWLVNRFAPNRVTSILIAVMVCSFGLNILTIGWKPQSTFYLLPTRAWEFAAGALTPQIAAFLRRRNINFGLVAAAGLAALLVALAIYDPAVAFPGWFAVLPVFSTVALLIAGADRGGWWTRAAATPMPVYIGKISYELYLVHWPVRVFAPILVLNYDLTARWLAFACCAILAAVIYHVAEAPIRSRRILSTDRQLVLSYVGVTGALILALFAIRSTGIQGRFDRQTLALADRAADADLAFRSCEGRGASPCAMGDPAAAKTWLVYGDSHADALGTAFSNALRSIGAGGYLTYSSGCLPVLDTGDKGCRDFNRSIAAFLAANPAIRHVVLVSTWRQPLERGFADASGKVVGGSAAITAFDKALDRTIISQAAAGRSIYLWMPVPGARRPVPSTLARNLILHRQWDIGYTRQQYDRQFAFLTQVVSRHESVRLIQPADDICEGGRCRIVVQGRPLYHDDAHPAGSQWPFFADVIRKAIAVTPR